MCFKQTGWSPASLNHLTHRCDLENTFPVCRRVQTIARRSRPASYRSNEDNMDQEQNDGPWPSTLFRFCPLLNVLNFVLHKVIISLKRQRRGRKPDQGRARAEAERKRSQNNWGRNKQAPKKIKWKDARKNLEKWREKQNKKKLLCGSNQRLKASPADSKCFWEMVEWQE